MSITAYFRNSTENTYECTSPGLELTVAPGEAGGVAFYGDELKFSYKTPNGTKKTLRVIWNLLPGDKEVEVQFQRGSGNLTAVCHELTGLPDPYPVDTEVFTLCFLVDDGGIVIVGIDDTHPKRTAMKPTTKARLRARNYRGRYNRPENTNGGKGNGRDHDVDEDDDDDDKDGNGDKKKPKRPQ